MKSAFDIGAMPRKPPWPARLIVTNEAGLHFISLQEQPKFILDTCRLGVVGTTIPRSWYRCSAYSVLQGSFKVDAGSTLFR